MIVGNATSGAVKTVGDPCASYESLQHLWKRSRAVCRGERFVKALDAVVDQHGFKNLLIPFSPSMTQQQYDFYKAEAELPGISAEFAKTLVGGLLRKQPTIKLPEHVPAEAHEWIKHTFSKDEGSLLSFLDEALWEEVQTSRAWVFVDYPVVNDELSLDEAKALRPYPVLHQGESIINWRTRSASNGITILDRVIVRGFTEEYDDDTYEFHPKFVETIWVHEINDSGHYQIRIFKNLAENTSPVVQNGDKQIQPENKVMFQLSDTIRVLKNGEPLSIIPAWPVNGVIEPGEPLLTSIIDKEIALYNKISRRNHLLYGAATYTPVLCTEISDEQFEEIVNSGLGSWIRLRSGDKADVLKTPTEALQDMDRAIKEGYAEIAQLGVRMLSPEVAQSGVALELRNASQNAKLGSLNNRISHVFRQVIAFMISWRYNIELNVSDIEFCLSEDFNPLPLGEGWLRLVTEWYQQGLIPRSIWLLNLKQNDLIPPDYDDEEGMMQIQKDMDWFMKAQAKDPYSDKAAKELSDED